MCRQGYVSQMGSRCMSSSGHLPVTKLSEEEQAIRDLAAKVSREKIAPLVRKMDQESKMDPSIIKALFENGVRFLWFIKLKNFNFFCLFSLWALKSTQSTVVLEHLSSLQFLLLKNWLK